MGDLTVWQFCQLPNIKITFNKYMSMMNGGSTGRYDNYEQIINSYSSKYEIKKEIESLLWFLSQKKDLTKDDCMDILKAVHTELFDKLDKIDNK